MSIAPDWQYRIELLVERERAATDEAHGWTPVHLLERTETFQTWETLERAFPDLANGMVTGRLGPVFPVGEGNARSAVYNQYRHPLARLRRDFPGVAAALDQALAAASLANPAAVTRVWLRLRCGPQTREARKIKASQRPRGQG
jgi:phytoene dehydrogenase-like protein